MASTSYLIPLGGGNEIGASSYFYSLDGYSILVDAGIRLGSRRPHPDLNPIYELVGAPSELDVFLLTHAHLDHCGAIARIHHEAPGIVKLATAPTLELASVMLEDAIRVAQKKGGEDGISISMASTLLSSALQSRAIAYQISMKDNGSQKRDCHATRDEYTRVLC